MKINSFNSAQNFGRLKITATKECKKDRDALLKNNNDPIFAEIDLMSGKTPVEIRFDCTIRKNPRITGFVNKEEVSISCPNEYNIMDVYIRAKHIKLELLKKYKSDKGTSKYFV